MHSDIIKVLLTLQRRESSTAPPVDLNARQLLLSNLIKSCASKAKLGRIGWIKSRPLSRSETSRLFLKIFSGNCTQKEAAIFMAHLLDDDSFYRALYPLLESAVTDPETTETEMPAFDPLPDEPLIAYALSASPHCGIKKKAGIASVLRLLFQNITEKLTLRKYAPALAATALLLMITAALLYRSNSVYALYFTQADAPPIIQALTFSSLRSSTHQSADRMSLLNQKLHRGIADYLAKDYQSAIAQFEHLESAAESGHDDAEFLRWRQTYYFYYGMSYLGLSKGRTFNRSDVNRATQLLTASVEMGKVLSDVPDETRFFLGLSLFLKGDGQKALAQLRQLPTSSPFFESVVKLTADLN